MRRRSILAPAAVLAIGLAVSLVAGHNVERTADRELAISLERGASEIGMFIQSLTYGFDAELSSLAAVATVTGGDPALQRSFVEDQQLDGGYVLVDASGAEPRVVTAVADDPATVDQQQAAVEALLAEEGAARQLEALVDESGFGFVLGADDSPILALAAGTTASNGSRYAALRVFDVGESGMFVVPPMAGVERFAVYVGASADPSRAVLASTTELPLRGSTGELGTSIGDQPLLIEVGGAPAPSISPAAVTSTGIALTLALAGLLSTALRRRDAAVRALAAAGRAEQQFRGALLASPDVILRWNVDTDEVAVLNRSSFYGHEAGQARRAVDLLELVVAEDRPRVQARFAGHDVDSDESIDVRVRAADGTVHWARLRVGWMDPDGRTGDLLVVVTDLDRVHQAEEQRAAMEAELQQAQRMETIGQLAGGIAHDFNNLLAAISTTAELILSDVEDDGTVADVEAILDATQRGAGLTKRLLSFSRRGLSRREEVALDEVVADMADLLRRTLGEHIDLEVSPGAAGAHVLGDPGELEQVLLNLVVNARDALDHPGLHITVQTAVSGGEAVLTVRDDGAGMPPEVAARAFEPFFSTKTADGGTGLGLSIVYGIVTRMGGSVSIDSSPGVGTVVRVVLPTTDASPTADDAVAPPAPAQAPGEVVLLVEDEPAVRRAAQRLLERAGHVVVAAADGHEAVAIVTDGMQPTVLLTDVVLPGTLTGHDVAERVRAAVPGVRVVYASGYSRDVLTIEQLEQEHASFIAKPFTSRSLLGAVAGEHEVVPT